MPRSNARTRADVIHDQLRYDILNGHFAPGEKLGFAGLGARYDVSTGVLREVLPRLVEQGLATSESQLGFRVVSVSIDDLKHLTEARVAIEGMVLRSAVEHADVAWESGVVAAHHALVRANQTTSAGDITPEWILTHEQFHAALLSGCPNPRLVTTALNFRAIAEVYRCWSIDEQERIHRDVADEHRRLAEASIARDADLAVEILTTHIQTTTDLLIASQLESETADDRHALT